MRRRYILNIFGADDVTIIIAEVLTSGVTMTTLIRAFVGRLGTHKGISALRQATVTSKVCQSQTLSSQILTVNRAFLHPFYYTMLPRQ